MNEKTARQLAQDAGLKVSARLVAADGSSSIAVGSVVIRHDGKGGRSCWRTPEERGLYVGDAIVKAVKLATEGRA